MLLNNHFQFVIIHFNFLTWMEGILTKVKTVVDNRQGKKWLQH